MDSLHAYLTSDVLSSTSGYSVIHTADIDKISSRPGESVGAASDES